MLLFYDGDTALYAGRGEVSRYTTIVNVISAKDPLKLMRTLYGTVLKYEFRKYVKKILVINC